MLVGCLFILLFILGYTFWSCYVFRGKVRAEERLPLVAKTGARWEKNPTGRAAPSRRFSLRILRNARLPCLTTVESRRRGQSRPFETL